MEVHVGGTLHVGPLGALRAGQLQVVVKGNILLQGQLQASNAPPEDLYAPVLNCTEEVYLTQNHMLLVHTSDTFTIQSNAVVAGSQIAICSQAAVVAGTVTATALGIRGGYGPGAGFPNADPDYDVSTATCTDSDTTPGSGAGHGGRGGASSTCPGGPTYDDPDQSLTFKPGSGGGGAKSGAGMGQGGGEGGGIVMMHVSGELLMEEQGSIEADGEAAQLNPIASDPNTTGAGGGAGGSILLVAGACTCTCIHTH